MRRPEAAPNQDPATVRSNKQQLMALWKANGYKPELQPEPLQGHAESPPHFPWLWDWFFQFRPGISWAEIESWSRLRRIKPQSWECDLLLRLDSMR